MTHKQKVLDLLKDGKPHVHMELYRLGCVAHSRVADLRRDGYNIACWTANDGGDRVSVYQLVSVPLEELAASDAHTDDPHAAGSSSGPDPSPVGASASAHEDDAEAGPLQTVLEIPRGTYEAAA